MKKLFLLLIFFCLAIFASRAVSINGQNYVPLAAWARANGLNGFTLNRGDEILLTNRTTRLVFDVDSHDAEINGVKVRLSFPVANAKGVPLIAQFDLDTAVSSAAVFRKKITARRSPPSASTPATAEKIPAIASASDFLGTAKKPTRSRSRSNCATS